MLTPLARAIGNWTPGMEDAPSSADPLMLLGAAWEDLAGPEVAANSRPLQIVADGLLVITKSSAWSHQLSFLAPHLLKSIASHFPDLGIDRLRFRVGKFAEPPSRPAREASRSAERPDDRPPSATAAEALARFRTDVEAARRAKQSAGWKECRQCGVPIPPGRAESCMPCRSEQQQQRAKAVARLLYETPGIDLADAVSQVEGLTRQLFEAERRRLLSRWRTELDRAARDGKLSRNGRERLIASSYVLLKTGIAPERIAPATVRNELGDAVYDLIYGMER